MESSGALGRHGTLRSGRGRRQPTIPDTTRGHHPSWGEKEATRHRERYEARERGDLRHERPADDQVPQLKGDTTGNVGDKAATEHRERYLARQQGDYSREQPARASPQQRDTGRPQQKRGHGSHQADSAAGEQPGAKVRPVTTRGGVAWWKGENLQSIHDRDGVFNHFTYSWGGYSPPLGFWHKVWWYVRPESPPHLRASHLGVSVVPTLHSFQLSS